MMDLNRFIWELWDTLKEIQSKRSFFMREFSKRFNLTSRQMRVLVQIDLDSRTKLLQLARSLDMNPGNLSRLLTELEDKGFICRSRDQFDSRKIWISLAEMGERVIHDFDLELSARLKDYLIEENNMREMQTTLKSLRALNAFLTTERDHYVKNKELEGTEDRSDEPVSIHEVRDGRILSQKARPNHPFPPTSPKANKSNPDEADGMPVVLLSDDDEDKEPYILKYSELDDDQDDGFGVIRRKK